MIPSHSSLLLFVSAALVLLAIPGPAVLYVTSRSIGLGRSAGLVSALGIGVGTLVHVAAAAVGLSALLMSSAVRYKRTESRPHDAEGSRSVHEPADGPSDSTRKGHVSDVTAVTRSWFLPAR